MSSELKNGVYTIRSHRVPGTVATLPGEDALPGTRVVLLPPSVTEAPGQEWEVTKLANGEYTIINRGNHLSFKGEPRLHNDIAGYPEPVREWHLEKGAAHCDYHIVVPGGPKPDEELALDVSPLLIQPPLTQLDGLRNSDQKQAWEFEFKY